MDPWVGAGEDYRLPQSILIKLGEHRCYKLVDAQVHIPDQTGSTRWKGAVEFQLEGEEAKYCKEYIKLLESNCVCLDEDTQDKLIWTRNAEDRDFTAKKGYEVAIMEQFGGEKSW